MSRGAAILQSVRLPPRLMATVSTLVGWAPLVFEMAVGLERKSPLGIVAAFGLMVGTVLTLLVIPVVCAALDSLAVQAQRLWRWFRQVPALPPEALSGAGHRPAPGEPAPSRGERMTMNQEAKERTMGRRLCWSAIVVVVGLGLIGLSGCTYLGHRGRDAADMFEVGLTFSKKPQFALLPVDYFNLIGLGYSQVEGTYVGIGNRRVGAMPIQDDGSYGLLFWGKDTLKIGDFDSRDPHEVWVGEMEALAAAGQPLPTTRPDYNKGLIRLPVEGQAPPPVTFMQCRRNIHLGWIGLHASFRPLDMVDFLLGWTTLDILKDDIGPRTE